MILQKDLGNIPFARARMLRQKIQSGEIALGGNRKLKIYGRLDCGAGKRMKVENKVFFENATEAINAGYRPCGICMRKEYLLWRQSAVPRNDIP